MNFNKLSCRWISVVPVANLNVASITELDPSAVQPFVESLPQLQEVLMIFVSCDKLNSMLMLRAELLSQGWQNPVQSALIHIFGFFYKLVVDKVAGPSEFLLFDL